MKFFYFLLCLLCFIQCGESLSVEGYSTENPLFIFKGELQSQSWELYPDGLKKEIKNPHVALVWMQLGDYEYKNYIVQDLGELPKDQIFNFQKKWKDEIPTEIHHQNSVVVGKLWLFDKGTLDLNRAEILPESRREVIEKYEELFSIKDSLFQNSSLSKDAQNLHYSLILNQDSAYLNGLGFVIPKDQTQEQTIALLAKALGAETAWEVFASRRKQNQFLFQECKDLERTSFCELKVLSRWQNLEKDWPHFKSFLALLKQFEELQKESIRYEKEWESYFFNKQKSWVFATAVNDIALLIRSSTEYEEVLQTLELGAFTVNNANNAAAGIYHIFCEAYDCQVSPVDSAFKLYAAFKPEHLQQALGSVSNQNFVEISADLTAKMKGLYQSVQGEVFLEVDEIDGKALARLDSSFLAFYGLPNFGVMELKNLTTNGVNEFQTPSSKIKLEFFEKNQGVKQFEVKVNGEDPVVFNNTKGDVATLNIDGTSKVSGEPIIEDVFDFAGGKVHLSIDDSGSFRLIHSEWGLTHVELVWQGEYWLAKNMQLEVKPYWFSNELIGLELLLNQQRYFAPKSSYDWSLEEYFSGVASLSKPERSVVISGSGSFYLNKETDCQDAFVWLPSPLAVWGEDERIHGNTDMEIVLDIENRVNLSIRLEFCKEGLFRGNLWMDIWEDDEVGNSRLLTPPVKIFNNNQKIGYQLNSFGVQKETKKLRVRFLPETSLLIDVYLDFLELNEGP